MLNVTMYCFSKVVYIFMAKMKLFGRLIIMKKQIID